MSLKFEFYKTPVPGDQKKKVRYHARPVTRRTASTEEIVRSIQSNCTLTEADLKAALSALSQEIADRLASGERVHLEGLGYFQITLSCPETHNPDATHAQRVTFKSVKFRADQALRNRLSNLKTERARECNHSSTLSEQDIDDRLTEFFSDHDLLTRRVFQEMCHFTTITANRHLKRLLTAGRLQNINTRYQPIYTPAPGNYRKSYNEQ